MRREGRGQRITDDPGFRPTAPAAQPATAMPETITETRLPKTAHAARKAAKLTQVEAAKRLGVNQASISQAENDDSGVMLKLQRRMIEELAGWKVEGPFWRITKPDR